ncbi:uncharacterized protein [Antedon mediterranea]|uniref:uncharacterized protein n=1 Tax=Antedon mediterranea TaxID=105859 RepID=UPI003AF5ED5D
MSISRIFISCTLFTFVSPVFSNFLTTEKPESLAVVEGGTAIFHCHVSQQVRESYDIAWFSDSRNVFLSTNLQVIRAQQTEFKHRYSIIRSSNHRFDLKIENVRLIDAGLFSCMYAYQDEPLQKSYYTNVGHPVELVVLTAPTPSSPVCLINALPTGDVEFECSSEGGNPTPTLQLNADNTRLNIQSEVNGHNTFIRIKLTEIHRGVTFTCILNSQALQTPKTCSLTPLLAIVRITPKIGRVVEDGEIKFNCSSHGLENPTYEWMASPNLILTKRFLSDSETVSLTIRGPTLADNASKIMCVARGANGDKVASEQAILIVEDKIGLRITQKDADLVTTIAPGATELPFIPAKPRVKHTAIDFFQNNVLILAVCVAGLFIVLLSMVALIIVCRRKRKSYNISDSVDDDELVGMNYAPYAKIEVTKMNNGNLVSETDKMKDEKTQELINRSPLVTPAASPTRSQPPSPKHSPILPTSKHSPTEISKKSCATLPASFNKQSIPKYAKPMKGTPKNPPPEYAMPIKRDFHLSLEDVTRSPTNGNSPPTSCEQRKNNEYAELTNVAASPSQNYVGKNKYEEVLIQSPVAVVDPRKLNAEGLKYADLEINQNCSSEIHSDISMKTQYAKLAQPSDAIDNI